MLPNALLRAVIRCGDEAESDLVANLDALRGALTPEGIERELLIFITDLTSRAQQVPSYDLLGQQITSWEQAGDPRGSAARTRLDLMNAEGPEFLTGADFHFALGQYREHLLRETLGRTLTETASILGPGVTRRVRGPQGWENVVVRGPEAAYSYLTTTVATLAQQVQVRVSEGSLSADGAEVLREYQRRKADPAVREGALSGLRRVDELHHGLNHGELALVMGFVSHYKSTLVLNWAYHTAIVQRKNVAIVALETTIATVRNLLYTMHSSAPKFRDRLPRGEGGLRYEAVKRGMLSPEEERVLEAVVKDLETGGYGQLHYKEPQEETTVQDIRLWAEGKHRQTPIDLIVIDYLGLVDPEKHASGIERSGNLNRAIRQTKLLATSFANGRGVAILSPFQANRRGFDEAGKGGGRYTLTALADAHEAERSGDLIYYTWVDDGLRGIHELRLGNLKNRDGPIFTELYDLYVDPASRRIESVNPSEAHQEQVHVA